MKMEKSKQQKQIIKMKNLDILKKLKPLLGDDKIVITGSTALELHGFETTANDIDLVIANISEISKGVLDRLQKENPSKKFKEGGSVNYSFIYEGIKIDVWLVSSDNSNLQVDGFYVASVKDIVAAKLSYNRPKDWVQLMKLSKQFFDQSKFDGALSSIGTDDEDYPEE